MAKQETVTITKAELRSLLSELAGDSGKTGKTGTAKVSRTPAKTYVLSLDIRDKGNGQYAVVHGAGRSRFIGFKAHVRAMVEQGILEELSEWAMKD